MAATIKIKNSSTAGAAPTSSDLVQGELAVNVTDKRLFTENSGGTVVELGTNPSSITLPDGSASAPTLLHSGDTNTGLFFPAADTVGITTGGTERARVDSSGNLGLGVTPSAWASNRRVSQVGGSASAVLALNGTSAVSEMYFNSYLNASAVNTYAANGYAGLFDFNASTAGGFVWKLASSGTAGNTISFTQAMTLDSSGNWILGGTTARTRLTLQVGEANAPTLGTASGGAFFGNSSVAYGTLFGTSGSGYGWIQQQRVDGTGTAYDLCLQPSGGNLLVGTTSNPLSARLYTYDSRSTSSSYAFGVVSAVAGNGLLAVRSDGYVQMEYTYNSLTSAASVNMIIGSGGYIYRATSAAKYKQDVRDLGSVDIGQFRPVRYKSKCADDDQTKDHIGFIADDYVDNYPELVQFGETGEVEGFAYDRMTAILCKAIQEQQAIITQLQADVAALKG